MRELKDEEVRTIQTDILKAVDIWCRQHGVRYFMAYGTLLGAVRHKGYIPWDDDIDICMLRQDYERFLREFNQGRSDGLQVLHSSIDSRFPYEFSKVSDTKTKLVEDTDYAYEIGVNLDVFVLDNIPEKTKSKCLLLRKLRLPKRLLGIKLTKIVKKKRNPAKQVVLNCGKWACRQIPMYYLTAWMDRIARTYAAANDSICVADVCQRWFKVSDVLRREWFDETIELEFEGSFFPAPVHYDEVLTVWYGDYMQLPPKAERVTHHSYRAYQR